MEYQVQYRFNGIEGIYYVTFSHNNLRIQDIEHSIKKELIKHLRFKLYEDELEIISINRIS